MVQTVQGSIGVAPIECVNPRKNKWRVRWNITEADDGSARWVETDFAHEPTADEIRTAIYDWYNANTEAKILSGFEWNGTAVWLSQENQFNYKAAYDAAVMSSGETLPVKFKFGDDKTPIYYEFATIDELADFYYKSLAYIQSVLQEGWNAKDAIDWTLYGIEP